MSLSTDLQGAISQLQTDHSGLVAAVRARNGVSGATNTAIASKLAGDATIQTKVDSLRAAVAAATSESLSLNFIDDLYQYGSVSGGLNRGALFSDMVTLARSSVATRINREGRVERVSSGQPRFEYDPLTLAMKGLLIESAATNLIKRAGDSMTTSPWGYVGVTITPATGLDGVLTANRIIENSVTSVKEVRQTAAITSVAGTSYTYSIYAKQLPGGADRQIRIGFGNGGIVAGGAQAVFNLRTQTLASVDNGTASIQKFADGWARYSYTVVATNSASVSIYLTLLVLGGAGYQGDGVSGCDVFGPQLEAGSYATSYINAAGTFASRSTTATYIDSNGVMQTAGVNVARDNAYGYDEIGRLKPIGLLLEPSSSNLLSYSQDYVSGTAGTWASLGPGTLPFTITPNAVNGTRGVNTMTLLARQDLGAKYLSKVFSANAGTIITRTQRIKAAASSAAPAWLTMRLQTESYSNRVDAWFNPVTGECGAQKAGDCELLKVSMTKESDGVWLCTLVGKSGVGAWASVGTSVLDRIGTTDAAPASLVSIYIDCAQVELGASATSYIPTTTTQVTRAADVATPAQAARAADVASVGIKPWFNPSGGTLLVEFIPEQTANTPIVLGHHTGSTAGITLLPTNGVGRHWNGVTNISGSVTTLKAVNKIALAYTGSSSRAISVNGGTPTSDPTAIGVFDTLRLGISHQGSQALNGYIRAIRYYPRRLTDAELKALTA